MTTISVVLPTYNRAHTLGRALASAFGQTRPPDEVLVVDDHSGDDTAGVVRRFPAARLIRLDRNRGAAGARNEGVRQARGDLVAFLDSDDVWMSHKLEVQERRLAERPDLALVCTGITVRERGGRVTYHGAPSAAPSATWSFDELQRYPFSTPTWLVRRAALQALGLFDDTLPNCEDLDLLARMIGRHGIEVIDEPLILKYNQSDGLNSGRDKTARSYAILFERHRALWDRAPDAAARAHQRLANLHIAEGDMAQGRAELRRALARQPLQPRLWALLALARLGQGAYLAGRRLKRGLT